MEDELKQALEYCTTHVVAAKFVEAAMTKRIGFCLAASLVRRHDRVHGFLSSPAQLRHPISSSIVLGTSNERCLHLDALQAGVRNDQEEKPRNERQQLPYQNDTLLFVFPIFMAAAAFLTHRPLSSAFHNLCDFVSAMAWDSSSEDVLNLVRTGLNGPVVTSVAILFGTLVATTISIKMERNTDIQRTGIQMSEAIRTARIYFDSFPRPYSDKAHVALDAFMEAYFDYFWNDDVNVLTLRELTPLVEDCIRVIHEVSALADHRGAAVGEAYGAMNSVREHQTTLIASVQRRFPLFHYANLVTLAMSICVMFLIETDPNVITFAAEPQLALSWSLLVGTFSMLFVVVFDLSHPLGTITRVSKSFGYFFCLRYVDKVSKSDALI